MPTILKVKQGDEWIDIPAIKGKKGDKGDKGDRGPKGDTIAIHVCSSLEYDPVTRVPTVAKPEENIFYLVPVEPETSADLFDEWIWINNAWEKFGSARIDLSNFITDVKINDTSIVYGQIAWIPNSSQSTYGVSRAGGYGIYSDNGVLKLESPTSAQIKAGTSDVHAITPLTQDESTFYGLAKVAGSDEKNSLLPIGTYSEEAKSAIQQMLDVPSNGDVEEALESKAEINGHYEDMTVGNAEQIISTRYVNDSIPYLYRTTGGSADVGNRESLDKIIGGTVVFNQICPEYPTKTVGGITLTNDGHGKLTASGTSTIGNNHYFISDFNIYSGHKYLVSVGSLTASASATIYLRDAARALLYVNKRIDLEHNEYEIVQVNYDSNSARYYLNFGYADRAITGSICPQIIDLTKMFGSVIADYIYSLEQANYGAGVAWFKKYFPNEYYEYNSGELMSVSGLQSHDTVGFNSYDPNTGKAKIIGGVEYQITGTYTSLSLDGQTVTPDEDGCFTAEKSGELTVTGGDNSTTCVHLVLSGTRDGEYEAYQKHSYPLDSSLVLRGIPKIDTSGNLYYDGDEYESDGTVNRKYGVVDLGALTWRYNSNSGTESFYAMGIENQAIANAYIPSGDNTFVANAMCSNGYKVTNRNSVMSSEKAFSFNWSDQKYLTIRDTSYSDSATFKSAMSGVYLVYELDTPIVESAEPYQQIQVCDDWGTEEFVSTGIIPVGNITKYFENLRDKIQHLPNPANNDGLYLIHQENGDMELVPHVAPVQDVQVDGTSVLSNGVANVPVANANSAGVVKINALYGLDMRPSPNQDTIRVRYVNESLCKAGANDATSVNPVNQHIATFYGLAKVAGADMASSSNPVGTYTDAAKVAIQKMLGVYEAPWELINEETFTNATEADKVISTDSNGQAFELTDAIVLLIMDDTSEPSTFGGNGDIRFVYGVGNNDYKRMFIGGINHSAGATPKATMARITTGGNLLYGDFLLAGDVSNSVYVKSQQYYELTGIRQLIELLEQPVYFYQIVLKNITGPARYVLYGKRKWTI